MEKLLRTSCMLLLFALLAACSGGNQTREAPEAIPQSYPSSPNTSYPSSPDQVTISGWLSVVRNGGTHYFLVDDQGQTFELLLDEELAKKHGGPQSLDRQRVSITGQKLDGSSEKIQVISLEIENES